MLNLKKSLASQVYLNKILMFLDVLAIIWAFLAAYTLRNTVFKNYLETIQPIQVYLLALPFAIFLMILIFALRGLYEPKNRLTPFSETVNVVKSITWWMLFIMALSYLIKIDYSRIVVVLVYFFTLLFVVLNRVLIRYLQNHLIPETFGRVNVLIVGAGRTGKEIAKKLSKYQGVGYHLIGFLDDDPLIKQEVLGKIKDLKRIIKKFKISEVYFANPSLSYQNILDTISKNFDVNVKFKIASNVFSLISKDLDLADLESIPSLDLKKVQLSNWYKIYKRNFDLLFSLLGLIITLPLWLIIYILISFESKGPAILTQKRVGTKGKFFNMYKFRTMYSEVALYDRPPTKNGDIRVTKVGAFLRRTSLDELPQLLNVLRGEMSIVGPRPEMGFIVKKYTKWQKRRLEVKPGLTGLWQILGRKDLPLAQNLEYDFYYINNQSVFLDLAIVLKTIPLIIFGKGAY